MCGIIGIAKRNEEVFPDLYDGLLMLQHRGQDSAGMVTLSGDFFHAHKDNGLVKDVFLPEQAKKLTGTMGLGHVRYPTAGTLSVEEAQPFFVNAPFGIYLIHNGNLTNTQELRERIQTSYRRYLRTKSDSEVLLNVFADKIYQAMKADPQLTDEAALFAGTTELMKKLKGAYSIITLVHGLGLFAFRDPNGIRPLSLGRRQTSKGEEWAFASEDVAFATIGFEKVRDVAPGEAILIDLDGKMHSVQCVPGKLTPCIFEYVYLARPDSMLDGISVYKFQLRLGQALAKQIKAANLEIDSVIPVPDSSRHAALELAKEIGVKYREGLVKNRYVGRTFIMPGQELRKKSVRRKLNAINLEFRNRNILLVDDSIVRGTTIKQIIAMCRKAGANKIYVASAAPPVQFPNVYGIDMPNRAELIAHGLKTEEICKLIGADGLFYQDINDMIWAAKEGNPDITQFDCSCFNGEYITGDIDQAYIEALEGSTRVAKKAEEFSLINI